MLSGISRRLLTRSRIVVFLEWVDSFKTHGISRRTGLVHRQWYFSRMLTRSQVMVLLKPLGWEVKLCQ